MQMKIMSQWLHDMPGVFQPHVLTWSGTERLFSVAEGFLSKILCSAGFTVTVGLAAGGPLNQRRIWPLLSGLRRTQLQGLASSLFVLSVFMKILPFRE